MPNAQRAEVFEGESLQLKTLFDEMGRDKGPLGRMNLALLTKITSFEAFGLEDSIANLKLVGDAAAQLRKQG